MSGAAAGGFASSASLATSAARAGTGQKPRGAARLSGYMLGKGTVGALSLHEKVHKK